MEIGDSNSFLDSDGLLEGMLGVFIVVALLASGKFLLVSSTGVGSLFLILMVALLVSSLALMLLMMFLYKLEILERGQFLNATIFVVFASLFGLVSFFPAVYYLEGWWIIHTIGTIVVVSLILAKIMVGLVAGKSLHLFRENKKQEKITLAG